VTFLVWFVARFGVDAPFQDDWALSWFFSTLRLGGFTFDVLWSPINEHRMVFPRLIWAAMALLTNWSTRANLYLDLGVAFCGWLMVVRMMWLQSSKQALHLFYACVAVNTAMYFSIVQYQNSLHQIQLAKFLVQLLAIVAVFSATTAEEGAKHRFWVAVSACVVATFSFGHGVLLWIALLQVIFLASERLYGRVLTVGVWLVLFALSGLLYATSLNREAGLPDLGHALQHPTVAALFFLGLLGNPFTIAMPPDLYRAEVAAILGAVLLGVFLLLLLTAWRSNSYRLVAPWIALGTFSVLVAGLTAIARSGWGFSPAVLISRYTTEAIYLPLSMVQVAYLLLCRGRDRDGDGGEARRRRWEARRWMLARPMFYLGLLACAGAVVGSSIGVIRLVDEHTQERKVAGELMRFAKYIDPSTDGKPLGTFFALSPFEGHKILWAIHAAAAGGFQRHIKDASFSIDGYDLGRVERIEQGRLRMPRTVLNDWSVRWEDVEAVRMTGWVHVSDTAVLPEFVFAGCAHSLTFVSVAPLAPQRLVLARKSDPERRKAGWELSVPVGLLPEAGCQLWAWIYDSWRNEFIRLRNIGEGKASG
jgi:hypothetical protein